MKKTQFTEQKIVAMLKQHEQGLRAVDIVMTKKKEVRIQSLLFNLT